MTADDRERRTAHLAEAAAARTADAASRARRAIMRLESTSEAVTFVAVARCGQVSTSFLYQHCDLRQEITSRRNCGTSSQRRPDPASATAASLRVKLQVALQRNRELVEELSVLRTEKEALRSRVLELGHRHRASRPGE